MRQLKSKTGTTLSTNKAIQLFAYDDSRAFDFIYRTYSKFVYRICIRMLRDPVEAEDAAQDVFVCVFRKISSFRGESAFSSWLYRLATNIVLMRFRRNKHRWISLQECCGDDSDSSMEISAPDMNLSGLLDRIDIQAAMNALPDGYRTAFSLHEVQGYDHREIAEIFGCSVGNSKSQLHKARVRLRKLLVGMPRKRMQQAAKRKPIYMRKCHNRIVSYKTEQPAQVLSGA